MLYVVFIVYLFNLSKQTGVKNKLLSIKVTFQKKDT